MNIDYEAIAKEAGISPICVKAIIEAYEAQKKAPEWVPLDLEKVTQGQEVRRSGWETSGRFVCMFQNDVVVSFEDGRIRQFVHAIDWLMRAPKPKTVRVKVYHLGGEEYVASIGGEPVAYKIVGEGDIQVTP